MGLFLLLLAPSLFPYPTTNLEQNHTESWRFMDTEGQLLRESVGKTGMRSIWTPLEDLSPYVVAGTIAIEDKRFYRHFGIDSLAFLRAATQNIQGGRVISGASTLTMQLARILGQQPRSIGGKISQMWDASRIERTLSKEEILEHYLNRAPYGAGAIGVEAASQRYFGKPSRLLSLSEAALIAGLPQAPSLYNPFVNLKAAQKRQTAVLSQMQAMKVIDQRTYERAIKEPIQTKQLHPPVAMHFTDYLLKQGPKPGEIATTLNRSTQKQVEQLVRDHVEKMKTGGLTQASVVVLDNTRCAIRVMVGSTNYWSKEGGSVNGSTSLRQPGSALKPFTYATGFMGPYTPASPVGDIPTRYLDAKGLIMAPNNYDKSYQGPILMAEALGRSLNVPAIRVANGAGIQNVLDSLRRAGFTSFTEDADHYGLGLTLGNGEVNVIELVQAYASFARSGMGCTATGFQDETNTDTHQVFSEDISYLITNILSDESIRIRAFGIDNPLLVGFPMAIKTGTSTNWRDNWAVGYTKEFTIGVWTGDFSGRPMNQLYGAIGAGPLFRDVARLMARSVDSNFGTQLPLPTTNIQEIDVCPLSGMTPSEHCPSSYRSTVLNEPKREICTWHKAIRIDKRNGLRASDKCPKEHVQIQVFEQLPQKYTPWVAEKNIQTVPAKWSPYCPLSGITANAIVITNPQNENIFLLEPGYDTHTQTLALQVEVDPPVEQVSWLVDDVLFARVEWPYTINIPLIKGKHIVQAKAGKKASARISFHVR